MWHYDWKAVLREVQAELRKNAQHNPPQ
jgi:hypothetical protein